jgi:hypothetical protein
LVVIRRFVAGLSVAGALVLGGAAAAYAEATPPPPAECSDPGYTCSYTGGEWNVEAPVGSVDTQYGSPDDSGPSVGGMFALFAILGLVFGGIGLAWRVSTARRIAEQAGLDPDTAVSTAILNPDGLAATYVAATLRPRQPEPPYQPMGHLDPPSSRHTVESRLTQLKQLHDEGLITDEEYDHRRAAILDTV